MFFGFPIFEKNPIDRDKPSDKPKERPGLGLFVYLFFLEGVWLTPHTVQLYYGHQHQYDFIMKTGNAAVSLRPYNINSILFIQLYYYCNLLFAPLTRF